MKINEKHHKILFFQSSLRDKNEVIGFYVSINFEQLVPNKRRDVNLAEYLFYVPLKIEQLAQTSQLDSV